MDQSLYRMYSGRRLLGLATLILLALPAWAQTAPLTSALVVQRVELRADGTEALGPADTAVPGDLLVYTATYTNASDRPLRQVRLQLPIPEGLVWVPGAEAADPDALVLADGRALPLPVFEARPAAAAEVALVRALVWNAGELAPGEVRAVTARARVQ